MRIHADFMQFWWSVYIVSIPVLPIDTGDLLILTHQSDVTGRWTTVICLYIKSSQRIYAALGVARNTMNLDSDTSVLPTELTETFCVEKNTMYKWLQLIIM